MDGERGAADLLWMIGWRGRFGGSAPEGTGGSGILGGLGASVFCPGRKLLIGARKPLPVPDFGNSGSTGAGGFSGSMVGWTG